MGALLGTFLCGAFTLFSLVVHPSVAGRRARHSCPSLLTRMSVTQEGLGRSGELKLYLTLPAFKWSLETRWRYLGQAPFACSQHSEDLNSGPHVSMARATVPAQVSTLGIHKFPPVYYFQCYFLSIEREQFSPHPLMSVTPAQTV